MEVPHTPALEATSHHSFTISGVCDEFLRVIGVLPNRPLPALASGANTPGSLTLSDRSDLVNGKLFSNIILSVRSWHPLRLSTSNLDVLRSCVRGDGVKASSSKLWSVLAPILDTVFDLYIGDDLLFQLETVSQGLPAYDELECSMLSLLEDLCINGSQIVKFPAHSATPVAEDPPTPSVVDTEDDSGWSPDKFIRVITPRTPRSPRDVSLFSDTGVAAYCDITIQSPDLVGTALGRPYTADTVVSIGSMDGGPQVTPQHSRKQSHYTAARPSPIRLEATLPPNTQNPTDMCWKLVEDPVIGALIQHLPAVIGVSGLTLHDACARIASTFNDGDPNAKECASLFGAVREHIETVLDAALQWLHDTLQDNDELVQCDGAIALLYLLQTGLCCSCTTVSSAAGDALGVIIEACCLTVKPSSVTPSDEPFDETPSVVLAWLLWDWACPSCAPPAALVNVVEPGHWVNLKRRYQRIRMAAFRVLHPKLLTWVPSDGPWVIGAVVSLCGLDPAGFMKGSMCVPSTSGSSVSSSSSTRSSVPLPSPLPPRVPKQPSSTATHQRRMYSAGRGRAGIRRAAQDLGALSVLTVCTRKCVEVGVSDPFLLTFRQSVLDLLPVILDSACIRAGEIDFSGDTRAVDDAAVCIGACVSVGQLALSAPEQPSFGTSIGKIVASLGQLCRCDQQQLSSRALTGLLALYPHHGVDSLPQVVGLICEEICDTVRYWLVIGSESSFMCCSQFIAHLTAAATGVHCEPIWRSLLDGMPRFIDCDPNAITICLALWCECATRLVGDDDRHTVRALIKTLFTVLTKAVGAIPNTIPQLPICVAKSLSAAARCLVFSSDDIWIGGSPQRISESRTRDDCGIHHHILPTPLGSRYRSANDIVGTRLQRIFLNMFDDRIPQPESTQLFLEWESLLTAVLSCSSLQPIAKHAVLSCAVRRLWSPSVRSRISSQCRRHKGKGRLDGPSTLSAACSEGMVKVMAMVGIRPSFRVAGPHCAIVTLDPTSIITLFFGAARPTFPSAALGPASSVLRRSVADLQRVGEYAPPSAPKPLVRSSVSVVRLPSNRPPRQSLATSTVTLGSQGFSAAGNKKKATSPRPKLGSIAEVRTDEEAANTTDGTISSDDAFVLPAITGVPHSPIVPKPVITTVTGGRPSRQHLLHSPYKAPSAAKRRVVRGGIAAASSRPPHGDDGSDALTVTGSGLPHVLLAKAVPP